MNRDEMVFFGACLLLSGSVGEGMLDPGDIELAVKKAHTLWYEVFVPKREGE